jgi:hypothetical protein
MKKSLQLLLLGLVLGISAEIHAATADSVKVSTAVKNEAAEKAKNNDDAGIVALVKEQVALNPDLTCEIVKAAILGSNADTELVAAIVEAAGSAAPKFLSVAAQCATAVAPDAKAAVQAVVNKATGNQPTGEVASEGNPLDFPGQKPGDPPPIVGPNPGAPGGFATLPVGLPVVIPPVVVPPTVPEVTAP